jgi:hypothetical protein
MNAKAWVVVGVGLAFGAGVLVEAPGFNGPWYWNWAWRDVDLLRTALVFGIGLLPILIARRLIRPGERPLRPWIPLALLVAANFLMQLVGILVDAGSLSLIGEIVRSPNATSYFSDARNITSLGAWLPGFHEADLALHSSTHPPGPILYYYFWLKALGPGAGATAGGLLVGLFGSFGVAAVYQVAALWTSEVSERFAVASTYALVPATIHFFPEFDQVYPLFTLGLVAFWIKALEQDARYALAHGALLWLASFFAYQLVTVGAFLAFFALYFLLARREGRPPIGKILGAAAVSLGVFALAHLLVHVATGYRPIASFRHALQYQQRHSLGFERARPWLDCVLLDPYDFLIGAGMTALPLLVLYGWRVLRERTGVRREAVLSAIGLATILIVDLSGLLRAETARVWLFLQPLLILPAGLELARLGPGGQEKILWVQWLTVVLLKCKMWFIHV